MILWVSLVGVILWVSLVGVVEAEETFRQRVNTYLVRYCADCHSGSEPEGGLDLDALTGNLADPGEFRRWEQIYDRVRKREMPPPDAAAPSDRHLRLFLEFVQAPLHQAHLQMKGTVLRRLNRREYQNTLNDLFGTNLQLETLLPEDGKSHEFDNVGSALGISVVHLQKYMEAATLVLDDAVAKSVSAPEPVTIEATYRGTAEAKRFVGKVWKELEDGAIVRFSGHGYPTGMIRGSGVRTPGRYRIRVTGYTYQSESPITFSVGGTSFARGSGKPIYGFFSFRPGAPQTIELETTIEKNYMVQIEPFGIADPNRYQRESIEGYQGPGLAILGVSLHGPLLETFPSRGHRLVFDGLERREIPPPNPNQRNKPWYKPRFEVMVDEQEKKIAASLQRVAEHAFRRPVKPKDIATFLELYRSERKGGGDVESSLRMAVTAIFCSPRFLYLSEQPKLDNYMLASRLAYFLHRTTPDEELLRLAAEGALSDPQQLKEQTERLLDHPRFDRFLVDFCDSWLDLREMDFTAPDAQLYPEFDDYLRYSMPRETREFLRELIAHDLPPASLVQSEFAMLNQRLAEHYGIPGVEGPEIRRVQLPQNSLRGGLLGQASILKVTANGTTTSPVTRGAWVLERLFAQTPPPPPPGIPGVEPDIRGASTLRELLDKHRNLESCRACHQLIDPPGFALEVFDPIGGFRDRYRSLGTGDRVTETVKGRPVRYRLGPAVDSSGQFPDGTDFDTYLEFRRHLARQTSLLTRTMTKKLLTFGTGRELGFSDRPEVNRIATTAARDGSGVRALIHAVVQSEVFRNK